MNEVPKVNNILIANNKLALQQALSESQTLGFESFILYYHYYFLRARGTNRKTQSPFK